MSKMVKKGAVKKASAKKAVSPSKKSVGSGKKKGCK